MTMLDFAFKMNLPEKIGNLSELVGRFPKKRLEKERLPEARREEEND